MNGKLTLSAIRLAAEAIHSMYYKQSPSDARRAAIELKTRMIMMGNTDEDSIYTYNRYSGYSWDSF